MLRKLFEAVCFLLCIAPVPVLAGYALMGGGTALFVMTALTVPAAYVISLLPGHVGGAKKQREAFVERASAHSDPDPDRNLRRDTHEDDAKSVSFPLRAAVCGVVMLGAAVFLFFGPVPWLSGLDWLRRALVSLIPAFVLPLALRFCALGLSSDARYLIAGIVIYAVGGVAALFIRSDGLNAFLAAAGSAFLAVSLWQMNSQAMNAGAASRTGMKPPAALRRRNRGILVGLMLVSALIAGFDWLREKVSWLSASAARAIGRLLLFLSNLFGGDQSGAGGGGAGEADLSELMGEAAEPSRFWEIMTYVAYAVAAVILVLLMILFVRKISQLVRRLAAQIGAYFKRFARSVGEDYQDEQESLMDWGEIQHEMGENLKKRLTRLFQRDKKWNQMTPREQARQLVRVLYRRAGIKAGSRTLRETLPALKSGRPELLAEVYEQARYADRDPDGASLEELRRDEGI